MSRREMLQAEGRELVPDMDKVAGIREKAQREGRELTAGELAFVEPVLEKAQELADAFRKERTDEAIRDQVKSMFGSGWSDSDTSRRLSFGKSMAAGVAKQMAGGPDGVKALAGSGAAVVGQEFVGDPVALGQPAQSLLSVLPVKQHSAPEFAYLRQSVRTNLAAVVAEGAVKPTSAYTVVRVEDSLDVVAHLSEGIPRFWLVDTSALEEFISSELRHGLQVAVEAVALSTIVGTSGVQSQTYATSVLATLRKAITKLETAGHSPAAIVLHPTDFEGVELALSTVTAIEHMNLPFDAAARRLWGVPIVSTVAQTVGVGTVLADGAAGLDTDSQGVGVQWSENSNADDFSKNLIRARCEGRFAASVYSPLGVVQADLTP